MPAAAVLVYLVAEITALTLAVNYLGIAITFLLLLASAALGGYLLRRAGTRTMRAAQDAMRLRMAADDREVTDGLFRTVAGLLILIPGFLSTVAGLACLFPPTRAVLRRTVARRSQRYLARTRPGTPPTPDAPTPPGAPTSPGRSRQFAGDVIDGEILDEH